MVVRSGVVGAWFRALVGVQRLVPQSRLLVEPDVTP
jgi:hypothetical protein